MTELVRSEEHRDQEGVYDSKGKVFELKGVLVKPLNARKRQSQNSCQEQEGMDEESSGGYTHLDNANESGRVSSTLSV
jgi:hypothetical protein